MMPRRTMLFVRRELVSSLRARWFVAYSIIFVVAGLLLTTVGLADSVVYGYRGFVKAFAGLVHLALLFVPLLALFPAVQAIADERDSGALEYMLSQPVTSGEVYTGKWCGVSAALLLSLAIGFGVAGATALLNGVPLRLIVTLFTFVLLLALVFVAVGLCCSTLVGSKARAMTAAIVSWLVLVALGTLGIMVAFVRWGLPEAVLVLWTFVNPIEAFRIGVVSTMDADLSVLGPVGASVIQRLGQGGTIAAALLSLVAWIAGPGVLGWKLFGAERASG